MFRIKSKGEEMSDTDIHSCGYYCDRHACIVTQRNELRDKLFSDQAVKTYSGGKPNYTQPEEIRMSEKSIQISDTKPAESARSWVGLTDEERANCSAKAYGRHFVLCELIEAKLKEKNT